MRLTDEQVQESKKGLLEGKEILKGRTGENMFDNLLDYVDTIEALQQENEQLKVQTAQIRKALKQARSAMYVHLQINDCDCLRNAIKVADKAIDKIGGREDV